MSPFRHDGSVMPMSEYQEIEARQIDHEFPPEFPDRILNPPVVRMRNRWERYAETAMLDYAKERLTLPEAIGRVVNAARQIARGGADDVQTETHLRPTVAELQREAQDLSDDCGGI
jgi:hypothetical protein